MTITTLLLDIAGTVVRSGSFEDVFRRVYADVLGVAVPDEHIRTNTGRKKATLFAEVVRQFAPERAGEPDLPERMASAFDRGLIDHVRAHPPEVLSGVPEALERARGSGLTVGYVTGFAHAPAAALLEACGLEERAVLVGSDEVEHGRPAPDLIFEAMRRLGVPAAAAVAYAGDTPGDIRSGVAAGCARVFGLTCGAHSARELEEAAAGHDAVAIVESLEVAVDRLAGLGLRA